MALIVREGGRTIPAALVGGARGGRLSALLRGARPRRFRRARAAARPDRRAQPLGAARSRRLRLHLAVEFPAGDLHRPDRRRARRRQRGRRQAGRADAARRRRRGARCCTRPASPATCCICCPATAQRSARRSSPIRASPASPLPVRPRRRGRSIWRSPSRPGPIVPLIAETGGQNAMIVDSSALARAGRRRRAELGLRQRRPALLGAARALRAGRHRRPPPGDAGGRDGRAGDRRPGAARDRYRPGHRRAGRARRWSGTPCAWRARAGSSTNAALPAGTEHGTFFAPRVFEIDSAGRLEREVFGPILHVVRWQADRLDQVLDEIDATGYGLTLGIHSRIDETVAPHPRPAARRQHLRQPQHDRRRRRRAAVRRRAACPAPAPRPAARTISTASPPSAPSRSTPPPPAATPPSYPCRTIASGTGGRGLLSRKEAGGGERTGWRKGGSNISAGVAKAKG